MAVSPDLLEILRCPYCVSGETRKPGDDPGRLELVNDAWLVCQEPDCDRKYPIKEDIPVMLIDEGDKWANTPVEELPDPGPLVEPDYLKQVASPGGAISQRVQSFDQKRVALLLLSLLGAIVLIGGLVWWFRQEDR